MLLSLHEAADRSNSGFDRSGSDGAVAWADAHDGMGMPIDMIRIDALAAAGLVFAAVAGGSVLKWKK
jgi:hypothetical protein